jgi:hypothetical protein
MKRIIHKIRLSLLLNIKRIKSYILKINREPKRSKTKKLLGNNDDDPYPVYIISNRRAKLTPVNSRGEFGSFCYANKLDKPSSSTGCRSPPVSIFVLNKNQKFGGV